MENDSSALSTPHKAFVAACLTVAVWFRARLDFNSAYMDESDYLFVGRRLLAGETWPSKEYIFSSDLPLLFIGLGEGFGGLLGARATSLLLGLISLAFYFKFVKQLEFGKDVAGIATALLAVASPHINISKLATYDAMCLAFFSVTAWLVARILTSESKGPGTIHLALLASLLMGLAILSKYVAALYAPLFGLALIRWHPIASSLPSALLLSAYAWSHQEPLRRLYEVQIAGVHGPNSTTTELLTTFGMYCAIPLLGCLAFFLLSPDPSQRTSRLAPVALLVSAVPLVAYHLHALNRIAFHKHLVFALFFLLPLAAQAWVRATTPRARPSAIRSAFAWACAVAFVVVNVYQVRALENGYPNTRMLEETTLSYLEPGQKLLSEDPYLFRYLAPEIRLEDLSETSYFDSDGDGIAEEAELVRAVEDGIFDLVVLNDQVTPDLAETLRRGPLRERYQLVFDQPYVTTRAVSSLDSGRLALYLRKNGATAKARD